ncbi:MAG TPA: glycosyltransferase [Syntrophales bacterium]|nr:glycosyltransferase [Syntrophales bacterium]
MDSGISVFLTDKKGTIPLESSLSAILIQKQGAPVPFEVVVAGHGLLGSVEGPAAGYRTVLLEKGEGWFGFLRQAAEVSRFDVLAFTDSHCIVSRDWISRIKEHLGKRQVLSGAVDHGERFVERFSGVTTHGEFLSPERKRIANLFDGNFVIRKEALKAVLPDLPVKPPVSDGAGALLLARVFERKGIPVCHEPGLRVFHESETFLQSLRMWFRVYGPNTLITRCLDRSLPGARFTDFPWAVPVVFASGRGISLMSKILRNRRAYRMKPHEAALSLAWISAAMVSYGLGMVSCEQKITKGCE